MPNNTTRRTEAHDGTSLHSSRLPMFKRANYQQQLVERFVELQLMAATFDTLSYHGVYRQFFADRPCT